MKKKHMLIFSLFLSLSAFLTAGIFPLTSTIPLPVQDRSGRLIQSTVEDMNVGTWIPNSRVHYYYNAINNTQIDSMVSFDNNGGIWYPMSSAVFTYEPGTEYVTTCLMRNYMTGLIYGNATQVFDNQHRLINLHMYAEPTAGMAFIQNHHFTYNETTLTELVSSINFQNMPSYTKDVLEADAVGRISRMTEMNSTDSLNWGNNYRSDFVYHASDTNTGASLISLIAKKYILMVFTNHEIDFGRLASDYRATWMSNSTWVDHDRDTFYYNDALQLTSKINEYGNTSQGQWNLYHRFLYTYDTEGNMTQIMDQTYQDPDLWNDLQRTTLEYDNSIANEDIVQAMPSTLHLSLSPNPFHQNLRLICHADDKQPVSVRIYDLKGRMIQQMEVQPGQEVQWSGHDLQGKTIASGIYFIKATQGNQTRSYKTIHLK